MTLPLYFLPLPPAAAVTWCGRCGRAATEVPLSLAHAPFLSPTPSQTAVLRPQHARAQAHTRARAHTHTHTHAHTQTRTPLARRHTRAHAQARAHTPCRLPLYIMQLFGAVSLPALNYLCQFGGQSRRAPREHDFPSIPKPDQTPDDAPRRSCALCCHQLFPRCCLLGQPVSRR